MDWNVLLAIKQVIKKQNDWSVNFLLISFGSIIPQRPSSLQNTPNDDKVKKIRKKKARQKAIETISVRANSMTYYLISRGLGISKSSDWNCLWSLQIKSRLCKFNILNVTCLWIKGLVSKALKMDGQNLFFIVVVIRKEHPQVYNRDIDQL